MVNRSDRTKGDTALSLTCHRAIIALQVFTSDFKDGPLGRLRISTSHVYTAHFSLYNPHRQQ
jgi:hypothetical protein